jgi:hypothetical protein
MSLDHEFLKLEPKEKRLAGTVNVSDVDLKDHRKYHQLLLVERTHLGSDGAGAGSGSKDSSGGG